MDALHEKPTTTTPRCIQNTYKMLILRLYAKNKHMRNHPNMDAAYGRLRTLRQIDA